MTLFKVGRIEVSYTSLKPKEYIAPVVVNSAMGLVLNPQGRISRGTVNLLLIMFAYKFVTTAKSGDIGKLLDLTIKYGITVVCFYILPYAIHLATHGGLGVQEVREITALLVNVKPMLLEG